MSDLFSYGVNQSTDDIPVKDNKKIHNNNTINNYTDGKGDLSLIDDNMPAVTLKEKAMIKKENIPSVTDLSNGLKKHIESGFSNIKVKGEISGFKLHSSGHAYFAIKDDLSVIDCVCWRGTLSKIKMSSPPRDGMEVIISGNVTTYAGRSKYQIVVSNIEIAGKGDLLALLQELKLKLQKEGLFDESRKKPLPKLPKRIGIVTSPTGAVIRDMLHRISDRMPSKVLLYPVNVQGDSAKDEVAKAICELDKKSDVDVIIVARGGGSIEDLWTFNEEKVVRAISQCKTPIISAIGHETDTTLADYAADYRAPTPTGAAEKVVPVRLDLLSYLDTAEGRLSSAINRIFSESSLRLDAAVRGIPNIMQIIEERQQWIDDRFERMVVSIKGLIDLSHQKLDTLDRLFIISKDNYFEKLGQKVSYISSLLDSYSYKNVLERGFSIVRLKDSGKIIKDDKKVNSGDKIEITVATGSIDATVD